MDIDVDLVTGRDVLIRGQKTEDRRQRTDDR